jgi:hypothetical protein
MSTAEQAAAALRDSVERNRVQQEMVDESRVLLADLLEDRMRIAVAEGIEAVLTSEVMWNKVFAVLQQQATRRTGQFVLGGLTAVFKKFLWIGAFALIAYGIGGWTLLKAVWAALTKA